MKKITDIKQQVKNVTRCNVYLDNCFYCGLELETVMRYRLKVGMEIEEERLDEIQFDSERTRAMDKALNFISRTKKTEKQVRDYLCGKGYTDRTAEEVIGKMQDYGYLDDGDYAADFAKSASAKKGKRLIAAELRRKGVGENDVEKALDVIGDETESAYAVAEKYMRNKERDKTNILKCYKYLLSKGFDYDTARAATEKLMPDGE